MTVPAKRGRGKPLKYKTPEALKAVIDKYFKKTELKEYTVTGLALVVGSKQLLDDYQKRTGYGRIVTKAKLIVENAYELSLRKTGKAGDIFALKNFGWKDKQEVEHLGEGGKIFKIEIDLSAKLDKKVTCDNSEIAINTG